MAESFLETMFGVHKPVVAMVHVPALPGRPLHDAASGMDGILRSVAADLEALQLAGVDGVMFCNEYDYPYQLEVGAEVTAAMAYVIGRLRGDVDRPFGVNVLWDAHATLALARAVGAAFCREVFLGAYAGDFGLLTPSPGDLAAFRSAIGAGDVRILTNITPEFCRPLDDRSVADRVRSAEFLGYDAALLSGHMAGEGVDESALSEAKAAARTIPVLANTGVRVDNVARILKAADGVVVGTTLKRDEYIWNPVDRERAADFMAEVRSVRATAAVPAS